MSNSVDENPRGKIRGPCDPDQKWCSVQTFVHTRCRVTNIDSNFQQYGMALSIPAVCWVIRVSIFQYRYNEFRHKTQIMGLHCIERNRSPLWSQITQIGHSLIGRYRLSSQVHPSPDSNQTMATKRCSYSETKAASDLVVMIISDHGGLLERVGECQLSIFQRFLVVQVKCQAEKTEVVIIDKVDGMRCW